MVLTGTSLPDCWAREGGSCIHARHKEKRSVRTIQVGEKVKWPVAETCGQSECHKPHDTEIVLGKMGAQTVRHCTSCHPFTADVPLLATRDSARGSLVPGETECLGCHEMQQVLADFSTRKDPHGGKCGSCHDPHTQKTPAEATSCATAGCHDTWRDDPFHSGENHKRVGARPKVQETLKAEGLVK